MTPKKINPAEINRINESILELWEEFGSDQNLYPMLYDSWETGGLLTVGINPAFQIEKKNKNGEPRSRFGFLRDSAKLNYIRKDPDAFYRWPQPDHSRIFNIDDSFEVEKEAREKYAQYFAPHWAIRNKTGLRWHHIDTLFVRRTDQNSLDCSYGKKGLTDFGLRQFKIFEKLLELGEPEILVFLNSTAANLYRESRELRKSDALECYIDHIGGRPVPVLFSGPVGDGFTKDRLAWHTKTVLDALRSGNPSLD